MRYFKSGGKDKQMYIAAKSFLKIPVPQNVHNP